MILESDSDEELPSAPAKRPVTEEVVEEPTKKIKIAPGVEKKPIVEMDASAFFGGSAKIKRSGKSQVVRVSVCSLAN